MTSADYDGDYSANDSLFRIEWCISFTGIALTIKKGNRQNVKISLLIEAGTPVKEKTKLPNTIINWCWISMSTLCVILNRMTLFTITSERDGHKAT
jgi:hypothetical protein